MGILDKVRRNSQTGRGHVKQRVGRAAGSRRLQAEGLADRVVGTARQQTTRVTRQVVNWLKDAGRDLRRGTQH